MRILHTSDWHLGRQFHNVSLIDEQRKALEEIIEYIMHHDVDVLVIAGDIYDRSVPPTSAVELMNNFVNRVCGELNLPVIMIPGNHDGAERLGFGSLQMKSAGLHILSSFESMLEPITLESKAGKFDFYGIPYSDPEVVRHRFNQPVSTHDEAHELLAKCIKERFRPNHRNILICHCFVDGAMESASERPLSIGGVDRVSHEHFSDFDYVALGHLHQPQMKGKEYIRYSGSLMKYSFSEQHHRKGMTLVEFDESGQPLIEHINLTAARDMRIIEGEMEQILADGKADPLNEDFLLIRLMDQHAILNPMEKLRAVYPNVLHLEKPGMLIGVEQNMADAKLSRSELDMFKDFFTEAQGCSLSEEQGSAISNIIDQLNR